MDYLLSKWRLLVCFFQNKNSVMKVERTQRRLEKWWREKESAHRDEPVLETVQTSVTHLSSLHSVRDEERSWRVHCIFQRLLCSCPLGNFLTGRCRLNAGSIVVTFHLPFFSVPGICLKVFYRDACSKKMTKMPVTKAGTQR